jgi:hypothetical protein
MLLKNDLRLLKVQIGLKSRKNRNISKFKGTDRIVTSGNYGVDTIKVKITNSAK